MEDVGGVDVLEAAENLVDKRLKMGISERLSRADDGSQITFHKL